MSSVSNQQYHGRVKKIRPHWEPHWEEYLAIILARIFGEKIWPGISTAPIVPLDGSETLKRTPLQYLRMTSGWWLIGTGKSPLDEHGLDDEDATAALLTVAMLGLEHDPKVQLLLKFAALADNQAQANVLDISRCVTFLTHVGWQPDKIEAWLTQYLDLFLQDSAQLRRPGKIDRELDDPAYPIRNREHRNLKSLFNRWLNGLLHRPSNNVIGRLVGWINVLDKANPSRVFNLAEGVALMNAMGTDPEAVYQWVTVVFEAVLQYQKDFLAAVDIVREVRPIAMACHADYDTSRAVDSFADYEPGKFNVLYINQHRNVDNNRLLPAAARFVYRQLDLDLVIVQRPPGNVCIFRINDIDPRFMEMTTRAIRLEEMIITGTSPDDLITDFDLLVSPEAIPAVPIWYFFLKGTSQMLFDGSFTQPGIPPTAILLTRIVEVIREIIRYEPSQNGLDRWLKKRI
ncbi:hypothetical protein KKF61_01715 [Patescibacteria group bacterium]|nr:hypothetical protein [Patescibacteria group bacterium]